jgi:transposase-like protein
MMIKCSAPNEPTPARRNRGPGFQRRYGLDVQDLAIRLRGAGRSWSEVAREVGVSPSQIKRWVWAKEREEGKRGDAQAVADVRKGPGHPSEWYEARLRQIGAKSESGLLTKEQLAGLRNAADAYWKAFQIMRARTEGAGGDDDDLKKYNKHLDKQFAKMKEKFERARAEATAAEPIEMTAERVEDGSGVGK